MLTHWGRILWAATDSAWGKTLPGEKPLELEPIISHTLIECFTARPSYVTKLSQYNS